MPVPNVFSQFFNQVCFTLDFTILLRMQSKQNWKVDWRIVCVRT